MQVQNAVNSEGCSEKIIIAIFTVVFGIAFVLSLFVIGPELENYFELQVCQPETIVKTSNGRGKEKTIICVDKKTGRKINVSPYQYFSCCPTILIIFLAIFCRLFLNLFLKAVSKSKMNKT